MKQEEILFFLGSACIVVFAWIAFTILHNSLTSTVSGTILQAITPIDPTFNTKIIDAMQKRTTVNPIFTIQPPSQNEIIVTSAPTQAPTIATPSGNIATQGGTTH